MNQIPLFSRNRLAAYISTIFFILYFSYPPVAGRKHSRHDIEWQAAGGRRRPERIPATITDTKVDIYRVEIYFTSDDVMKVKMADPRWMCPMCETDADNSVEDGHTSLACDSCLEWYHLTCLGKKSCPKAKMWICTTNMCKRERQMGPL